MSKLTRFLMSRLDPRAVPLFKRLAKVMAWPSLDLTVGAAITLMLALYALMTLHVPYVLRIPPPYNGTPLVVQSFVIPIPPIDRIIGAMTTISIVAFFIMPLVTGIVAALIASADVNSESFTLLKLTNIPRSALGQAYMATALWRLRVPLALVAALLPVFAFGITDVFLRIIVSFIGSEHLAPADTTVRWLLFAGVAVGLWGMNLFAAASAVQSVFRWNSRVMPLITTPLLSALVMGISLITSLALLGPAVGNPIALWGRVGLDTLGVIVAGLAIGPFTLWLLTIWSIRKRSHES